jgi:recombination protein RecA
MRPSASGAFRGPDYEIYGPESSGKTTLTLHLAANVQRAGGVAAYVDAEHALDVECAASSAWTSTPAGVPAGHREQALEIVEILVRSRRGGYRGHRLGRGAGAQGGNRRSKWATAQVSRRGS